MMERWRHIPGFGKTYEVSDFGRIRRASSSATGGTFAGRIRVIKPDRYGYARTSIRDETGKMKLVSVHVAILEAFVGPRPAGFDASHINGTRIDNRLENLCWESSSDNHRRKLSHGTLIHGDLHKCSKLKPEQVRSIRARVSAGDAKARVAREYGVSATLVGYIESGRRWPHL